jgi:hypothetical protein
MRNAWRPAHVPAKPVPGLIGDEHRFADKNMRHARIDSHFQRKWL